MIGLSSLLWKGVPRQAGKRKHMKKGKDSSSPSYCWVPQIQCHEKGLRSDERTRVPRCRFGGPRRRKEKEALLPWQELSCDAPRVRAWSGKANRQQQRWSQAISRAHGIIVINKYVPQLDILRNDMPSLLLAQTAHLSRGRNATGPVPVPVPAPPSPSYCTVQQVFVGGRGRTVGAPPLTGPCTECEERPVFIGLSPSLESDLDPHISVTPRANVVPTARVQCY